MSVSKGNVEPIPLDKMANLEEMKEQVEVKSEETKSDIERFKEKHPPLTEEDIEQRKRDSEEAQKKYSKDIQKVEQDLMNFLDRMYPMIDPVTNEAIAWVKNIPYFRMLELIPDDILDNLDEKPETTGDLIRMLKSDTGDYSYVIMSEMIAIPKKTPKWWKEHADQMIITLFDDVLEKVMGGLSDDISFF